MKLALFKISSLITRQGGSVGVNAGVAKDRSAGGKSGSRHTASDSGHVPRGPLSKQRTAGQGELGCALSLHLDIPGAGGQIGRDDDGLLGVVRFIADIANVVRQGVLAHAQVRVALGMVKRELPTDDRLAVEGGRHGDLEIGLLQIRQRAGGDISKSERTQSAIKGQIGRRQQTNAHGVTGIIGGIRLHVQRVEARRIIGKGDDAVVSPRRIFAVVIAIAEVSGRRVAALHQAHVGIADLVGKPDFKGRQGGGNGELIDLDLARFQAVGAGGFGGVDGGQVGV